MLVRAARFITASRSCGPYAVGKNLSVMLVETMCIRVHASPCAVRPAAIAFVCSHRIARYVSIMLVSRYWAVDVAGHCRRIRVRLVM